MLLRDSAIKRRLELENKISDCRSIIRKLPPGRLECHRNGRYYKWYVVKNNDKSYLKKSEYQLAKKLAYKRTMQSSLSNMINEVSTISNFIKLYDSALSKSNQRTNSSNIELTRLASEYHLDLHPEISEWENSNYEHLTEWESGRKVRSLSGHYFPSKDEAMIDDTLKSRGLLVRYEEKLQLCDRIAYPDFHILDPMTGKDYYWEHFGMMDDPVYREKNFKKLRSYIKSGYYPMINFITTFMGEPFRIDEIWIDYLIDFFFDSSD